MLAAGMVVDTEREDIAEKEEENCRAEKWRRVNSCRSKAYSTLTIKADGLEEVMRESTSRKIEQRAVILRVQMEQAHQMAFNRKIKNNKALQETEKDLLR